ncbi:MAG: hypothetical protein ABEL51_13430 [Salinibacter sp.]
MYHEEEATDDSTVEVLRHRIEVALQESLEEEWTEVLDQWTGASPDERRAVRSYVTGFRDRMLDSLLTIDSLEELKRGLAIAYVEVKCHWTMLNTKIQQQTAANGRPDEPLIYRATCVSLIVQALEPLLDQEYVEGLADFLVEPLS